MGNPRQFGHQSRARRRNRSHARLAAGVATFACAIGSTVFVAAAAADTTARQDDNAGVRCVLFDSALNRYEIRLTAITSRRVEYIDEHGLDRTRSLDDTVLLLVNQDDDAAQTSSRVAVDQAEPPNAALGGPPAANNLAAVQQQNIPNNSNTTTNNTGQPEPPQWGGPYVTLADGQQLPGAFVGAEVEEDTILWANDYFGVIPITLEQLKHIHFQQIVREQRDQLDNAQVLALINLATDATFPDDVDVMTYANGDQLSGYVSEIDDRSIVFSSESGLEQLTSTHERIADISLANPIARPTEATNRIWISDGTVTDVVIEQSQTVGRSYQLHTEWSDRMRAVEHESMVGLVFGAGRIWSLTDLESNEVDVESSELDYPWFDRTPGPIASHPPIAPMNLGTVRLSGPISVEYILPPNSIRFAAKLEIPRDALEFADFDVVIKTAQGELYRQHFDQQESQDAITFAIPNNARSLRIQIIDAGFGPIQDSILLHEPMILAGSP